MILLPSLFVGGTRRGSTSLFSVVVTLTIVSCFCESKKMFPTLTRQQLFSRSLGTSRNAVRFGTTLVSSSRPSILRSPTVSTESNKYLALSGGGSDNNNFDLAKCVTTILSDQNLSTLFAVNALIHGIVLVINPNTAFSLYGSTLEEETLGKFYAELIGAVNIGMAITLILLSKATGMSISKAVGWGLVPRFVVGVKNLITGNLGRIGFQSKVKSIAGKLSVAALIIGSLILEKGKPTTALKVISAIEVLVGLYISLRPASVVRTADIDVSTDDYVKAKALLGSLAQGIVSHGVYVGCLVTEGLTPFNALGAASAVVAVGQLYTVATNGHEDLDMPRRPFLLHSLVMGATAIKLVTSSGSSINEDAFKSGMI